VFEGCNATLGRGAHVAFATKQPDVSVGRRNPFGQSLAQNSTDSGGFEEPNRSRDAARFVAVKVSWPDDCETDFVP